MPVGMSSGAKALQGIGGRVAKGVTRAGIAMGRGAETGSMRRNVATAVARTGRSLGGNNTMRTGGAVVGMGIGAAGYGMHRRRGSQNYPMY